MMQTCYHNRLVKCFERVALVLQKAEREAAAAAASNPPTDDKGKGPMTAPVFLLLWSVFRISLAL